MPRITATFEPSPKTPEELKDEWKSRNYTRAFDAAVRFKGREMSVRYFCGLRTEPTTMSLLECLQMDAPCIDDGQTFDDWCEELGFNNDSIAHLKIYRQSVKQTRELKRLLGDYFERFMAIDFDEEPTANIA